MVQLVTCVYVASAAELLRTTRWYVKYLMAVNVQHMAICSRERLALIQSLQSAFVYFQWIYCHETRNCVMLLLKMFTSKFSSTVGITEKRNCTLTSRLDALHSTVN